jgi:lipoprotein-anchoring transpeptidase ErfK/SrfK
MPCRPLPRCTSRFGAFVLSVALLAASACSSSSAAPGIAASRVAEPVDAPSLTTPPSTVAPATTTTLRPLAAHEVLVAVVRPEIAELVAYDAPNGAPVTPELPHINPWYFGGELALLVTQGREVDPWVEVQLVGRPNGRTGWIRSADVTFRSHRFHMTVAIGERMLRAWEGDTLLAETPVVVGADATPTPLGRFYVNAIVPQANPRGAYGPVILSISSFSEALATFDGGLPEIAIHGTNQPSLIGRAVSNGCIRIPNDVVERLAAVIPLGTPVAFVA